MPFANFVVPLTGTERDHVALTTAVEAARPFNGRVNGLFVHPDPREAIPYTGVPISGEVVDEIIGSMNDLYRKAAKAAQASIAAVCTATGAHPANHVNEGVTVSYREVTGHIPDCIARASLLADMVVFAPPADPGTPQLREAMVQVLGRTARPLLLCADKAASGSFATKIAVGWDGSVPGAHALSTAVPYLKLAKSVELYAIHRPGAPVAPMDDPKAYLALHGISCRTHSITCNHGPIGVALQDEAAARGADLLVIGGYGHSRITEAFFGGVTVQALGHRELPVLLVH